MTCPKITCSDYENSSTTSILNIPGIRDNLRDVYSLSKPANHVWNTHLLHKDNVADYKELWGRQSCTWVGYGRFWIWKHELGNCDLYVLSCPTRGTSYEAEIRGDEKDAVKEIAEFLQNTVDYLREKYEESKADFTLVEEETF